MKQRTTMRSITLDIKGRFEIGHKNPSYSHQETALVSCGNSLFKISEEYTKLERKVAKIAYDWSQNCRATMMGFDKRESFGE